MTIVLRWREPEPALTLQWRGPDAEMIAAVAANPALPLAAIVGPPGAAGSRYVHTQSSASALWTINHNLGFVPAAVSVRSPGGVEVEAEVTHISSNHLTIAFAQPYAGSAYII